MLLIFIYLYRDLLSFYGFVADLKFPDIIVLVARHLYGYRKVLEGDGDPNRPDSYDSYNTQV